VVKSEIARVHASGNAGPEMLGGLQNVASHGAEQGVCHVLQVINSMYIQYIGKQTAPDVRARCSG